MKLFNFRRATLFSSLAMLALSLISCSDDDDNPNNPIADREIYYEITGVNNQNIVSSSYFTVNYGNNNIQNISREFSRRGEIDTDDNYSIAARVYLYNDTVNFPANKTITLTYRYSARIEREDRVTHTINQEFQVPPGQAGVIEYNTDGNLTYRLENFNVTWTLSNIWNPLYP